MTHYTDAMGEPLPACGKCGRHNLDTMANPNVPDLCLDCAPDEIDDDDVTITFLHPATRHLMTGTVIGKQRATGELLVSLTVDGSRLYVKPADVR
jgi:hypothetical protein